MMKHRTPWDGHLLVVNSGRGGSRRSDVVIGMGSAEECSFRACD